MKKIKKILALICVFTLLFSTSIFAVETEDDESGRGGIGTSIEIIFMNDFFNKTETAGFYTEAQRDKTESYWKNQYRNNLPVENFILPLPCDTTLDELKAVLSNGGMGEHLANQFEYNKLREENKCVTGSILKYISETYPFDINVVVYGDIMGGEETIGDGKVNILDLVKLRHNIVNQKIDEIKANNYIEFYASDISTDGKVNISDIVMLRAKIVEGK